MSGTWTPAPLVRQTLPMTRNPYRTALGWIAGVSGVVGILWLTSAAMMSSGGNPALGFALLAIGGLTGTAWLTVSALQYQTPPAKSKAAPESRWDANASAHP